MKRYLHLCCENEGSAEGGQVWYGHCALASTCRAGRTSLRSGRSQRGAGSARSERPWGDLVKKIEGKRKGKWGEEGWEMRKEERGGGGGGGGSPCSNVQRLQGAQRVTVCCFASRPCSDLHSQHYAAKCTLQLVCTPGFAHKITERNNSRARAIFSALRLSSCARPSAVTRSAALRHPATGRNKRSETTSQWELGVQRWAATYFLLHVNVPLGGPKPRKPAVIATNLPQQQTKPQYHQRDSHPLQDPPSYPLLVIVT